MFGISGSAHRIYNVHTEYRAGYRSCLPLSMLNNQCCGSISSCRDPDCGSGYDLDPSKNTRIHVSVCGCLCPELWLWYGTGITLDPDAQTESVSGSAPSGKTGSYKINGSGFASLFVPVFVLCCLWVWYSRTLYLTWIRVFFYNCIRIRPDYPDTQLCLYLSLFGAVVMGMGHV